jgi:succinoglycan biosynthesis transport protein ExoP
VLSLLIWFLAAFLLVLVPASIWNFSRPPVYRAAAAVLTIVPQSRSGFGGNNPDVQHVAIQRQLLLGRELLSTR